MAINLLVNYGTGTDNTTFTTGSYTPTANALVLALLGNDDAASGSGVAPTSVSGNGLTWVGVQNSGGISMGTGARYELFRAMGASPSAGGFTANFAANQTDISIIVFELTGVDTSGSDGAGAVIQAVEGNGTGTTLSITLSAFADAANNMCVGVFGTGSGGTWTPGTGFTELAEAAGSMDCCVEYMAGEHTTVDVIFSLSQQKYGIALEVKMAAAGGGIGNKLSGLLGGKLIGKVG